MAVTCKYIFGEFESSEFFDPQDPKNGEFFIGYEDCSKVFVNFNCEKVLVYTFPYLQNQRDIDFKLLFDYVKQDLLDTNLSISNKESIGLNPLCDIYFEFKVELLVNYLLLFKDELKLDPTVDNYRILFEKYKLACVDKTYKKDKKYNYIKDMLNILNIKDLIGFTSNFYVYNRNQINPEKDPIYYLANN